MYHECPIIYYVGITVVHELSLLMTKEKVGPRNVRILIEHVPHKAGKILSSIF